MKIKKIVVFLIILITIISITLISNAEDSFLKQFDGTTTSTVAEDRVEGVLEVVLGIIQVIAITVAIIMLIVLGMKYMVASAADRAEIKKHLIVYVTGAIIMFGATGILEIIKDFAVGINT